MFHNYYKSLFASVAKFSIHSFVGSALFVLIMFGSYSLWEIESAFAFPYLTEAHKKIVGVSGIILASLNVVLFISFIIKELFIYVRDMKRAKSHEVTTESNQIFMLLVHFLSGGFVFLHITLIAVGLVYFQHIFINESMPVAYTIIFSAAETIVFLTDFTFLFSFIVVDSVRHIRILFIDFNLK